MAVPNSIRAIPVMFATLTAASVDAQPTELASCFEPGSYCAEAPFDTLETLGDDCGRTFKVIEGRVAFPPLVNQGPVTIRVLAYAGPATTPLYVGVRGPNRGGVGCTTALAMSLVSIVYGFPSQCGGVWHSSGPIDLSRNLVPSGAEYHLQLEGFREYGGQTVAVACIQVERDRTSIVSTTDWGRVKRLYGVP